MMDWRFYVGTSSRTEQTRRKHRLISSIATTRHLISEDDLSSYVMRAGYDHKHVISICVNAVGFPRRLHGDISFWNTYAGSNFVNG